MAKARLAIGELSRRTGVPVKTLRFYSDKGLLPPAERSGSGYRLYADEALVRIDLIRTLREAGLGLASIKKVLRRETSFAEALRLRLAAIEVHVASLQRIGAALRAALRSEPNEDDVRRLCAVTRLSNEERRAVIESFYNRVSEGIPIDEKWKRQMIDASAPKLPDNPTPEQLDAWIELAELVADPNFVESLRINAKEVWGKFDMTIIRQAGDEVAAAAKEALARAVTPDSEEAKQIVERYATALAAARGGTLDDTMRRGMRDRFERHDPRAARYWELVSTLNGTPSVASTINEWRWITAAVLHHFADRSSG
ncbi:MAG: MerR family transcriptional regulator [Polyangiaceae bacterium]|jgi:DNA-binding transcriptional MerR regulator